MGAVEAAAGGVYRRAAEVDAGDLHAALGGDAPLVRGDGEAVDLLAGRAARGEDPRRAGGAPLGGRRDLGPELAVEEIELVGLAVEVGLVVRQGLGEVVELAVALLLLRVEEVVVVLEERSQRERL